MKNAFFLLLFLCAVSGCVAPKPDPNAPPDLPPLPEPLALPPIFGTGDSVRPKDSNEIGFVTCSTKDKRDYSNDGRTGQKDVWIYSVQFQNAVMRYAEDDLKLHRRMEWHVKTLPEVEQTQFP